MQMNSFDLFCDELVAVNMIKPMRREDYYKKYISKCDIKDFYDLLVRIE